MTADEFIRRANDDVVIAKRRATEVWDSMTDAERARAIAMRDSLPDLLPRWFCTGANPKGRVTGRILTHAQLLRWQGPV